MMIGAVTERQSQDDQMLFRNSNKLTAAHAPHHEFPPVDHQDAETVTRIETEKAVIVPTGLVATIAEATATVVVPQGMEMHATPIV
jgi:hypothetical protein